MMNSNTRTYQKASYGAVPSDVSEDATSQQQQQQATKRSQRNGMLVKGAILAATLVAGVLVGWAGTGYVNASQYWQQDDKEQQQQPSSSSHQVQQQQENNQQPPTAQVACDNNKNDEDTEAQQWAKIKETSLRK